MIAFLYLAILLALGWLIFQQHRNQRSIMANQADLDTALTNIEGQIQTLGADLQKTLADMEAKIAASGITVDLSPEVTRLQAIGTALSQFDTEATGDDPGPQATS